MWRRLSSIAASRQRELQGLELSGRGAWRLTLDAGAVVELGRGEPDSLAARFERFLAPCAGGRPSASRPSCRLPICATPAVMR